MANVTWRRMAVLAAPALLLMGFAAPAVGGNDNRAPALDGGEELEVPAGHKVSYRAYAEGVQIYRWTGTTWAFVAPDAYLYDGDDEDAEVVGIHYGGPTWESNSGSTVVGKVVARYTPDADAIPWLKLEAVSSEGPGIFHRVTYIQRVNTVGGLAPSGPGEFVGQVARVPYAADYVFYRKQQ